MGVDVDVKQGDREVERRVFRDERGGDDAERSASCLVVNDATGTRWRVTEISGHYVPGARGESCLVFESDCAIRRVWDYPRSWRELPGPDLLRVSWGR